MTIRVTTLANGVRVVTDEMPHLETVSIGVWIDAGSRYETPHNNGIAHLLEHMLFKGTERRTARQIAEQIEDVGGVLNAFTSRDHTTFYARVLKEDMGLAVDLLADLLRRSRFDADELEREREVVLQEIGQAQDTPDDIVFDMLQERAFPDQALGRSILGSADTMCSVTRDQLIAFQQAHYRGETLVVAAAGHVDHDILVRLVDDAFGDLPASRAGGFEPGRYEGGMVRADRALEQIHLTVGFPSLPFSDPDFYALNVFSTLLGGGMSSRLFQEVREERGLAYAIYSFTSPHVDTGLFGIYVGTDPETVGDAVPVMGAQMRDLCATLDDREIARARAQLKAGLLMSMESTSARVEQMGRQMLIFGRVVPVEEMTAKVEAVDAEAIERVCRRTLADHRLTVATVGPQAALPDEDAIRAAFLD
ncbi:putative Zn-dependent peptidase [Rhodothalassium salexigens DSM 2132]|uniref:Putative Zn-dependent peptidase n=1 Tax=Rhodothalassium salexigens DSM 2132 TaxID=1188247 RepID=A0A4R2PIR0_RHOSA|nr:pitrilysin family protein [Rhodothalassium salexigens]MBB4211443.1 putative Zn-dependent peptidase [Rhodothalassium salexigens DSM 2132]MBK1640110.1 peptidase M16 [Rhodothalassium salexigens DSM 2132]TCP35363.1 putative Zn-dependent peptidase [Rhodothalassium salexigens DSM 2132]